MMVAAVVFSAALGLQPRVVEARRDKEQALRELSQKAGLPYPIPRVFFRAFKRENVLEIWGAKDSGSKFKLVRRYPIARQSGGLGPKRREGDRQVPEGVYFIDRFNPNSAFHLSLGINYPNASDRLFADPDRPGGDIFIHGNVVSIGCLAMTDELIKEIYVLADNARNSGQSRIPVHFFPFRLDKEPWPPASDDVKSLWRSLKPIYSHFEKTRLVPRTTLGKDGFFHLSRAR